jgi:hypothetical protein
MPQSLPGVGVAIEAGVMSRQEPSGEWIWAPAYREPPSRLRAVWDHPDWAVFVAVHGSQGGQRRPALCTLRARRAVSVPKIAADLRLCWCAILGLNQMPPPVQPGCPAA